jgi:hypothetical protein
MTTSFIYIILQHNTFLLYIYVSNIKDFYIQVQMSERIVQLINTVYSQCVLKVNQEPYKSNTRCRTFMNKLQQVYDSVLSTTNAHETRRKWDGRTKE